RVEGHGLPLAARLAILDARGPQGQLDAPVTGGRRARRRDEAARQGGGIAPQLRQLPQAVLDLAILGSERDERDILLEGARHVAQRTQALAALAAQRLEALARREPDGHREQLGDARGAARRLQAAAQRVQRLEAHLVRRALVDEDPLQAFGQRGDGLAGRQQRPQDLEGRPGLTELGVQGGRQAQAQLARLVAGEPLETQAPYGAELAPAAVALEQALERGGHLSVQGAQAK